MMKIVVIGGTGLIGSKLVEKLREHGHEAVPASPDSGVNTLTGEGLADALEGAGVVVDVSNSPAFEDAAVMEFFETSTRNILAAEDGRRRRPSRRVVGRGHRPTLRKRLLPREDRPGEADRGIADPVLDRPRDAVLRVHRSIADAATDGDTVRLAPVLVQPKAAEDVAAAVGRTPSDAPVNGIVESQGPSSSGSTSHPARPRGARRPPRGDRGSDARYFGARLDERTLVPGDDAAHRRDPLRGLAQPATAMQTSLATQRRSS